MQTTHVLMTDAQRSVLGVPGGFRAYTPYGALRRAPGPLLAYCGQPRDRLLGTYYLGNGYRIYHAWLMRFRSPDRLSPFGAGGLNAYAYCAGDPANFIDPQGASQIRANLAMVSAGVGTAGADKTLYHGRKLMVIHGIEGLQKTLKAANRADLAGTEVPAALKSAHRRGFVSGIASGATGWAAGIYMNSIPEEMAGVNYLDVVVGGVVSAAVAVSKYFDSVIPRQPVSLESKLETLQRNVEHLHDPEQGVAAIREAQNTQSLQSETWL